MAKKTSKRTPKKTAKREKPAVTGLDAASTADLAAELRRRQGDLVKLQRKREKLLEQLQTIEADIREMGGDVAMSGRKRPKNESNLVDALQSVLKNKKLSVTEAAEAVQAAGYQSTAANFRTIVNQALLREKRFKKVSRGVYTAA